MSEDRVREEIAFIRSALEEGRAYAHLRSPDFTVWGAAIALGYLAAWARVAQLWTVDPNIVWWLLIGAAWIFSLRKPFFRLLRREMRPAMSHAVRTLRAIWLGYGITLTIFAVPLFGGGWKADWFGAVAAGFLGFCFFVSAVAANIGWLRLIAAGWWGAGIVLLVLRGSPEALLAGAGFMFALLFLPGLALWLRRPASHG